MHAAEDDELGVLDFRRLDGKPVRIAGTIGPAVDLVLLVVVPEDENALAEARARGGDAAVDFLRCELVGGRLREHVDRAQRGGASAPSAPDAPRIARPCGFHRRRHRHTENDWPHEHDLFAFGFLNSKPRPFRPPVKSSSMPRRYT